MAVTVLELFTPNEMRKFNMAAYRYAADADGTFMLDEGWRFYGERVWARYIKGVMNTVGLEDLAERIDPEQFAEGSTPVFDTQSRSAGMTNARVI